MIALIAIVVGSLIAGTALGLAIILPELARERRELAEFLSRAQAEMSEDGFRMLRELALKLVKGGGEHP